MLQLCFSYCNYACAFAFWPLFPERPSAFSWAHLVHSLNFLDKFGCVWLCDGTRGQTKCHIHWKVRLSAEHGVVGAEPCGQNFGCNYMCEPMFQCGSSTLSSFPWVKSQAYWSEWSWTFHIDHWSADDTDWSASSAHPYQLTEVSHQLTLKTSSLISKNLFGEDHSGWLICPIGSLPLFVPFGFSCHICLSVPGEMVCDHQNIFSQAFPRF